MFYVVLFVVVFGVMVIFGCYVYVVGVDVFGLLIVCFVIGGVVFVVIVW